MFDIVKTNFAQAAEDGYEFEIVLPTGELSGAFLTIRGDQSKTVKAYARKKYSEFKTKEQVARRRGKEVEEMSLDEMEDLAIEAALVRLIDWRGFVEGEKVVAFSKEKAAEILKEHPWIREQIMEEAQNVTNFRPE